jgi:hypothetical protein
MSEKNKNKKDVEEYGSKKKVKEVWARQSPMLPSDHRYTTGFTNVTPAMRDTIQSKMEYTGREQAGHMSRKQGRAAMADQQRWIGKGEKASSEARANALQMMKSKKSKKPSYTTPGGLVYDELKKQQGKSN